MADLDEFIADLPTSVYKVLLKSNAVDNDGHFIRGVVLSEGEEIPPQILRDLKARGIVLDSSMGGVGLGAPIPVARMAPAMPTEAYRTPAVIEKPVAEKKNPMYAAAGRAAARFSTKETQMSGEGLVEYVIFLDPRSLTKLPEVKGCWGHLKKCCCTLFGGYENNRLIFMREKLFPKLDGMVYLLDINSKEGNTFKVLNNRDSQGSSEPPRREVVVAGGFFQRNVLYKMLPKERVFVPNADWAEEVERSEIAEILDALQQVGAIAVDWQHEQAGLQLDQPMLPLEESAGDGIITRLVIRLVRCFTIMRRTTAQATALVIEGPQVQSPLSGKVVFRSNERPVATLDELLAAMGPSVYHLRTQPLVLSHLSMRMSRGIMMGEYFSVKHYGGDSTWLSGMKVLQEANCPPVNGVKMKAEDFIDCGFRNGDWRKRYQTRFMIVYPDVKDGRDARVGGDVVLDGPAQYAPGAWHPLTSANSLEDVIPLAIVRGAAVAERLAMAKIKGSAGATSPAAASASAGASASASSEEPAKGMMGKLGKLVGFGGSK
jgi:hypothetical protein